MNGYFGTLARNTGMLPGPGASVDGKSGRGAFATAVEPIEVDQTRIEEPAAEHETPDRPSRREAEPFSVEAHYRREVQRVTGEHVVRQQTSLPRPGAPDAANAARDHRAPDSFSARSSGFAAPKEARQRRDAAAPRREPPDAGGYRAERTIASWQTMLQQARAWVAQTPTPGEDGPIRSSRADGSKSAPVAELPVSAVAAAPLENGDRGLHLTIGAISVVVEATGGEAAPPNPRAGSASEPSSSETGRSRLRRHYLRP